jgi:hypothetical protein
LVVFALSGFLDASVINKFFVLGMTKEKGEKHEDVRMKLSLIYIIK